MTLLAYSRLTILTTHEKNILKNFTFIFYKKFKNEQLFQFLILHRHILRFRKKA
jgi:hypothetical protein